MLDSSHGVIKILGKLGDKKLMEDNKSKKISLVIKSQNKKNCKTVELSVSDLIIGEVNAPDHKRLNDIYEFGT